MSNREEALQALSCVPAGLPIESRQLAIAAQCYVEQAHSRAWLLEQAGGLEDYRTDPAPEDWPWPEDKWKPSSPLADLHVARALLEREIERLMALGKGVA